VIVWFLIQICAARYRFAGREFALHYTVGVGHALPILEIQGAKSHQIGTEDLPGYISAV